MRSAQDTLVSVVVPIYNVESYLKQCVDSILGQTYSNLQVILVDDGSPDDCGRIIDGYAVKDSRVSCIHKRNGGISSARNAGKAVAEGEYICFIDSDDYIDDRFIEVLLNDIMDNDADISSCYFNSFIEESITVDDPFVYPMRCLSQSEVILEMFKNDSIGWNSWNKLYKTELFDDMDYPEGIICEDKATTYKLYLKSKKVVYRNVPLYHYRIRGNSISGQKSVQFYSDSLDINSLMERDLENSGIPGLGVQACSYSAKCGLLIYESTRNREGYLEVSNRALADLKNKYRYIWKADYLGFFKKAAVWICGFSADRGKGLLLSVMCRIISHIDGVRNVKLK